MTSKLCVSCDNCLRLLDGTATHICECGKVVYCDNTVYCDTNEFTVFEVFLNKYDKIIRMLIKEGVTEHVKCASIR